MRTSRPIKVYYIPKLKHVVTTGMILASITELLVHEYFLFRSRMACVDLHGNVAALTVLFF
jgi:hypothetical protein